MRLADLGRIIDERPSPGAIMLLPGDWYWTMENPAAKAHQLPVDSGRYYYRRPRVWVVYDQSRIIDAKVAERDRWG